MTRCVPRSSDGGSITLAFDLPLTIPLTEPERRRVEFAGGTPIVLPDGRAWRLFEPRPVRCEMRGEHGVEDEAIVWDFGPGVDAETCDVLSQGFQKILTKIGRATNESDRASGILEGAYYLLARNYVICREEFEDLVLPITARNRARQRNLFTAFTCLLATVAQRACNVMAPAGEAA